jgi:hypothetical protein
MSGGGGSNFTPYVGGGGTDANGTSTSGGGGGGGPEGISECATLIERTFVNSPVPTAIAALRVGDVLSVELHSVGPVPTLRALTAAGVVVGSLTPTRLPQLVECIGGGFQYVAVVQEIVGARVRVEIRPR